MQCNNPYNEKKEIKLIDFWSQESQLYIDRVDILREWPGNLKLLDHVDVHSLRLRSVPKRNEGILLVRIEVIPKINQ